MWIILFKYFPESDLGPRDLFKQPLPDEMITSMHCHVAFFTRNADTCATACLYLWTMLSFIIAILLSLIWLLKIERLISLHALSFDIRTICETGSRCSSTFQVKLNNLLATTK